MVAAAVVIAAFAQGLFDPTGYAAASIVIWAAVVAGLVGRALPSAPVGWLAAAAGLCLAATAVLATASVAWASDQGRAFDEAVRVSFYLGLFVIAVCTATRAGRAQWLGGLAGGLGVVAVIALFSYLQPGILDSGASDVPNAAGRLSYPIGYWNGTAALLAAAATLLAYGGVTGADPGPAGRRDGGDPAGHARHLARKLQGRRGGRRDRVGRPGGGVTRSRRQLADHRDRGAWCRGADPRVRSRCTR